MRENTLRRDVGRLNQVVSESLERGVCLDGIRGIEAVLGALPVGGMVRAEIQTECQAASGELRAVWCPRSLKVELRSGGEGGARYLHFGAGRSPRSTTQVDF